MKKKIRTFNLKFKKAPKRLRLLLTILFISICLSFVILVVATLDEKEAPEAVRTVPHSIPFERIIDGGPPKDGIPSIDQPTYIKIVEADPVLQDSDMVFVVETKKEVKIFPLNILMWHQIINDKISDPPLVITYGPFVNNVTAYKSVYNGQLLTFGVSGKLFESNMLMYDRQTNSLWQQLTGKGVVGEMTGAQLDYVPSTIMPWPYAKKKFPDALILSRETGFERDYNKPPYEVYLNSDNLYFDVMSHDDRYDLKGLVHGIDVNGKQKAYPDEMLNERWLLKDEFEGMPFIVLKNPQTGAVKVFQTYVYGRRLDFELKENGIVDGTVGSTWNFDGEAVDGDFKGWELNEIKTTRVFWFAWSSFYPETGIYLADVLK